MYQKRHNLIEVKASKRNLPQQKKGAKSDVKYSVRAKDEAESIALFQKARKNLLNINQWEKMAGKVSATFRLTDEYGNHVNRLPLQGDYIKIHLPTSAEDKFDWVRIEAIEEKRTPVHLCYIMIRVRPTDPPNPQEATEHFFSREATSSFCVERTGQLVEASVRGRNELPNLDAGGIKSILRNLVVSLGAMLGLNYPQWKGLTRGIITT